MHVCDFHFPCRVFTGALSVEEQAYITFLADEKDVSVKEIGHFTLRGHVTSFYENESYMILPSKND